MEKITLFENECATLVYYPDAKVVHNTFRGHPEGKQFRDAFNAGVEAMKKYGGAKWLSDDRECTVAFPPEDQEWADNDWFPRMVQVGWKMWAMVVPNEIKSRINMVDVVDKMFDRGIKVAVFSDFDEAFQWLLKMA
jgi:hypothetical protein